MTETKSLYALHKEKNKKNCNGQGRIQDDFWRIRFDQITVLTLRNRNDPQAWANNVDPDQMPQKVAFYQGLHCSPLS